MAPIIGIIASSNYVIPNSYESIATATPNNAATVTFSSIPSTYSHLQLRIIGESSTNTGVDTPCQMTFNSDTGANYSYHGLYGNGSAAYGDIAASGASFIRFYDIARVGGGANIFGAIVVDILDYKDTNKYKTTRAFGGYDNNSNGFISLCSGNWRSTSAIDRIDISLLSGNWQNYSHIALYGIKG